MMKNGDAGIFPVYYSLKAVVNTVGGLLASRRVFCWLPFVFFFLVDKLRRKHHFKHANKKTREDCCIIQVTCKTVAFRFFQTYSEVRVPWHRAWSRVSCASNGP